MVWVLRVSQGQQTRAFLQTGLEGSPETTIWAHPPPPTLRQEPLGNSCSNIWSYFQQLWTLESALPRTVASELGVTVSLTAPNS